MAQFLQGKKKEIFVTHEMLNRSHYKILYILSVNNFFMNFYSYSITILTLRHYM